MAKFLVASYWLGTKKSFSDIKVTKDFAGLSNVNLHGVYGEDHLILTQKSSGYPQNIHIPAHSTFLARNWYYPYYEPSNRKYFVMHGSYVKKTFLENIGQVTVLLGSLQRGMEGFVFEQPVRNNNCVYIRYDFTNKMGYEYDYNGNQLTSYNVFINKDMMLVTGGWNDKDRWLSNLFYVWNIITWNKFNPLIETPYINLRYMIIGSILSQEKNNSAKIILGSIQLSFDKFKFLIVRPSDNTVHKVQPDGTFQDITSSVDLDDYESFMNNANDYNDYGLVDDATWQNLMGTDNNYLWFLCNGTFPFFILRFSSLGISSSEFIYLRRDYNKPIVIKDTI